MFYGNFGEQWDTTWWITQTFATTYAITFSIQSCRSCYARLYLSTPILQDSCKAKKKYMCVYCHMSKKSRVGRSGFFFYYYHRQKRKWSFPVPESDISFSKFPVKWRILQFFYLLCSQFRQKASSWINKTLLLVKQQKWLSEFCVKIHRVASKN